MRLKNKFALKRIAIASLSLISMVNLNAAGFSLGSQSANAMSTSLSSTAEAADASTIYYNPAGLTYLPGTQFTSTLFILNNVIKYKNAEAKYFSTHVPISGRTSGKITEPIFVPQTYLSYQLNDRVTFGLGVYVPFGSGTEYSEDSVLRYNVNKTELRSFNIHPTVAFKIGENHSIGFGVIGQFTKAQLRQFADYSPAMNDGIPIIGKQLNLVRDGAGDGFAKLKGDSWALGFNLGWLWDVNDSVRVGISYRSKIKHTLKGHGEWHLDGTAFTWPLLGDRFVDGVRNSGYVAREGGSVSITTPDILSIHGMWKVNPKLNLFGDATYTKHDRFSEININWENPKMVADAEHVGQRAQSNVTTLKPNWRATWRFGVGGSYQLTEPLQLRAGINLDRGAVRNIDERLSTMPDSNRITASLGGQYKFSEKTILTGSFSYVHIMNTKAKVNGWCGNKSAESGSGAVTCVSSRTSGKADFVGKSHILGLQLTHKF